jgi:hypothetical protein
MAKDHPTDFDYDQVDLEVVMSRLDEIIHQGPGAAAVLKSGKRRPRFLVKPDAADEAAGGLTAH